FFQLHVAAADMNSDGRIDLVTSAQSNLAVRSGIGDGTFGPATLYPTGGGTGNALALGDFDGNGRWDAAVTNELQRDVGVLLGLCDGTLAQPDLYLGAYQGTLIAVDLNGDGRDDVAALQRNGFFVQISTGASGDADHDGIPDNIDPCTDIDGDGFGDPGYA